MQKKIDILTIYRTIAINETLKNFQQIKVWFLNFSNPFKKANPIIWLDASFWTELRWCI